MTYKELFLKLNQELVELQCGAVMAYSENRPLQRTERVYHGTEEVPEKLESVLRDLFIEVSNARFARAKKYHN